MLPGTTERKQQSPVGLMMQYNIHFNIWLKFVILFSRTRGHMFRNHGRKRKEGKKSKRIRSEQEKNKKRIIKKKIRERERDCPISRVYNRLTNSQQRGKTSTPKNWGVLGITLNCNWWWGSRSGDLWNVEYPFIIITSRSTLTWRGRTC